MELSYFTEKMYNERSMEQCEFSVANFVRALVFLWLLFLDARWNPHRVETVVGALVCGWGAQYEHTMFHVLYSQLICKVILHIFLYWKWQNIPVFGSFFYYNCLQIIFLKEECFIFLNDNILTYEVLRSYCTHAK